MFAKRTKPVPQRRNSMRSDDEEPQEEPSAVAAGSVRKRLVTVDEDEIGGDSFRVKKSKLSKQMTRLGGCVPFEAAKPAAAASPPAQAVVELDEADEEVQPAVGRTFSGRTQRAGAMRAAHLRTAATSRAAAKHEISLQDVPDMPDHTAEDAILPGEDIPDSGEESGGDGGMAKAGEAARVARARRASAREVYGGNADELLSGATKYVPLVGKAKQIPLMPEGGMTPGGQAGKSKASISEMVQKVNMSLSGEGGDLPEDEEELADEWAMRQMKVGAHRRQGGEALNAIDADEALRGPVPASQRDQVPKRPGNRKIANALNVPITVAASDAAKLMTPSEAMALLWETLGTLEGGIGERNRRVVELEDQRQDAEGAVEDLAKEEKKLQRSLRVALELEEFSNSLGGLLDAKASMQRQAAETLAKMEQEFAAKRTRRRVRCFVADVRGAGAALSAPAFLGEEEQAAAERRERRWQRRRQKGGGRVGWDTSSGSEADGHEEFAADRGAFCQAAHVQIAGDVDESYSSVSELLKPLKLAKEKLSKEYSQAFVPAALPEALGMHTEHSLLWWDPLQTVTSLGDGQAPPRWGPRRCVRSAQLEDFEWFADLAGFTELTGEEDPDAELVPQMVRRCVFPAVERRLRDCWDVTSASQSRQVASLLDECLLFETDPSASSFAPLLEAAMARLGAGLTEFVPEVFVANAELNKWYGSDARRRLLWRSCKIACCATQLEGRLPDEPLARLVIGEIFGKRIAPHLKAPRLDPDEMAVVERYVSSLPERWLEQGLPPVLLSLRDALGPRAPTGPEAAKTAKAAAKVLQRLRCYDEAQVLLG